MGEVAVGPWPKGPFGDCGSVGTIRPSAQPKRYEGAPWYSFSRSKRE